MMGLLIKDLLCLRRQVKVYVIATVVYGGMTLMGVWDVSFFTWFFTLIAAMIPLSLFALDAAAKWDTYALTLPVGRNGVVAARYLFTLLVVCVGLVLSLAMGGLTMALGRMEDWGGFLMAASVAAGAGLLLNAVMLPVLYKVGPEKARIAMLAIMGGFVLVVFLAIRGMEQVGQPGLLASIAEGIAALPALDYQYREPSKFPGIDMDLSLLLPDGMRFADMEPAWADVDPALLTGVSLIDLFDQNGKRSITLRFAFSSQEKTLSKEEVQPVVDAIVEKLAQAGAVLRA